jgi:fluoroacetyl-CoA thioesterase
MREIPLGAKGSFSLLV